MLTEVNHFPSGVVGRGMRGLLGAIDILYLDLSNVYVRMYIENVLSCTLQICTLYYTYVTPHYQRICTHTHSIQSPR